MSELECDFCGRTAEQVAENTEHDVGNSPLKAGGTPDQGAFHLEIGGEKHYVNPCSVCFNSLNEMGAELGYMWP